MLRILPYLYRWLLPGLGWIPRPVLNISGLPFLSASSSASTQGPASRGLVDNQAVRDYTEDPENLLAKSLITRQRSFLRSFVEKIEVSDAEVKMYYTIPVPPDSTKEEAAGVVPIVHHG